MKEIWKDIKGYEGLYKISNKGRVLSLSKRIFNGKGYYLSKEKILSNRLTEYYCVMLYKNRKPKTHKIHRLLATHFIENPKNLKEINHLDCNNRNIKIRKSWANL